MIQRNTAQSLPLTEEELGILFDSALFRSLTAKEREAVKQCASPEHRTYCEGDHIAEAGTRFGAIGILTGGTASVIREGEKRRVIHRTLSVGDIFGVSALFGGAAPFPTTILADSPASVLLFDENGLEQLFEAVPRIARNYIGLLTEKIRFLNGRLDSLAGRSAEERVAFHLLSHIQADGMLGITKSALASLLGLGRASLYRILDLFEENGLIRAHRDRIEVINAEALKLFIKNRKEQ